MKADTDFAGTAPSPNFFTLVLMIGAILVVSCATTDKIQPPPKVRCVEERLMLEENAVPDAIKALIELHGQNLRASIEAGVKQASRLWTAADGSAPEFVAFCKDHYLSTDDDRAALLARLEENLEQVFGHLLEMGRSLRRHTDLDIGQVFPIDKLFAQYDLGSHAVEDFFKTKIAFAVLLNFELKDLSDLLAHGNDLSRQEWAQARAAQLFSSRVPSHIEQAITTAFVEADDYINNYNIQMGHLLTEKGERPFPEDLVLISHWGLRDELKSHYSERNGLGTQRLIADVMERIVRQEIPSSVIDNPNVDWVVATNEVRPARKTPDSSLSRAPEQDTRYEKLLALFRAVQAADPYHPTARSYIKRKFEQDRELPQQRVIELLESILLSDVADQVADLIQKRLGRHLEPFDIWYDGFSSRAGSKEQSLDEEVRRRYSTVASFEKDIPRILQGLGFDRENALDIGQRIAVDPARGAGHALGAERRGDKAHLRTRVPHGGMNYKGFNIAMHELGHNVEQVLSLDRIDHWLLRGVPNNAFTEGFAFAFQGKDLEILGRRPSANAKALSTLDTFWSAFEISGVAMVDIGIWEWLYEHPNANASQVRQAMLEIAAGVWAKYYSRIFDKKDVVLLAVYSHIIDAGMYTPDYPLGFLIQFQMESYFDKNGLAREMERMCRIGGLTPDAWMIQAVGQPVSAEPLMEAARRAAQSLLSKG